MTHLTLIRLMVLGACLGAGACWWVALSSVELSSYFEGTHHDLERRLESSATVSREVRQTGFLCTWAILGGGCLQGENLAKLLPPRRVVPQPQVKQSSDNISPVKSGIASFERESPTETDEPETERLLVVASPGSGARAVALSRGVRHEPGSAIRPSSLGLMELGRVGIEPHRHLQTLAASAANLCGVDPARYARLIQRESGGRHYAEDGTVLRSRSNAYGMAQVKHIAALDLAGTGKPLDIMDPWQNALAGACFWRKQFDRRRRTMSIERAWHAATLDYRLGPYRIGATKAALDYADTIMGDN